MSVHWIFKDQLSHCETSVAWWEKECTMVLVMVNPVYLAVCMPTQGLSRSEDGRAEALFSSSVDAGEDATSHGGSEGGRPLIMWSQLQFFPFYLLQVTKASFPKAPQLSKHHIKFVSSLYLQQQTDHDTRKAGIIRSLPVCPWWRLGNVPPAETVRWSGRWWRSWRLPVKHHNSYNPTRAVPSPPVLSPVDCSQVWSGPWWRSCVPEDEELCTQQRELEDPSAADWLRHNHSSMHWLEFVVIS